LIDSQQPGPRQIGLTTDDFVDAPAMALEKLISSKAKAGTAELKQDLAKSVAVPFGFFGVAGCVRIGFGFERGVVSPSLVVAQILKCLVALEE
jgi:hypothetical protein